MGYLRQKLARNFHGEGLVIVPNSDLAAELASVQENMSRVLVSGPLKFTRRGGAETSLSSGKMLRPKVILYTGLALGGSREKLVDGATAVELLHYASIIHDDIIDNATMRRGQVTPSGEFGPQKAVLWGDYFFAHALRYAGKLGDQAVQDVGEAVEQMVRGELKQLESRGDLTLSAKDCLEQCKGKTGALLSLAAKLGATVAKSPYTIRALAGEFGERFGIVFQWRDDYLDYFGDSSTLGKTVGRDMCEGVVTLPLLLAAHLSPQEQLIRAFAERSLAAENLPEVRRWIVESGAEQRFLQMMREQEHLALAALKCLPPSFYRDALASIVQNGTVTTGHG